MLIYHLYITHAYTLHIKCSKKIYTYKSKCHMDIYNFYIFINKNNRDRDRVRELMLSPSPPHTRLQNSRIPRTHPHPRSNRGFPSEIGFEDQVSIGYKFFCHPYLKHPHIRESSRENTWTSPTLLLHLSPKTYLWIWYNTQNIPSISKRIPYPWIYDRGMSRSYEEKEGFIYLS